MSDTPRPGDIYFDAAGDISGGMPTTYVVLSRDGKLYECWRGRTLGGRWMGGAVVTMWDTDLLRIRRVGQIPMDHLTP